MSYLLDVLLGDRDRAEQRNAAALAATQRAYDNLAPEDDDPVLDEMPTTEDAEQWVLGHAETVADCIAKLVDTPQGRKPIEPADCAAGEVFFAGAEHALAALMLGDEAAIVAAAYRLRGLVLADAGIRADVRLHLGDMLKAAGVRQ